ncbi:hypothetical protein AB0M20_21220 [Actinoplanes sp. NPDC051633]|uniref:hypothetical protein n=1 Tax=Actinoplanes sp. NPDC051633 TaxID=3155670 RepID=UPI0034492486
MFEPTLASLDELGSDEELAAAAREERTAWPDPSAEPEGRDETRSVTVRLSPGGRVTDVAISQWWRDELSPSALGDAVVDAYRGAVAQAVSTMAARLPQDAPLPSVSPVRPIEPGLDYDDWFTEIRRSGERAQENLERVHRLRREGAPSSVVSGPAGIVRLHAQGGTVTAAEIDVHAAMQESPSTVAADALAAFQAIR